MASSMVGRGLEGSRSYAKKLSAPQNLGSLCPRASTFLREKRRTCAVISAIKSREKVRPKREKREIVSD